jgi:hypothetical protein
MKHQPHHPQPPNLNQFGVVEVQKLLDGGQLAKNVKGKNPGGSTKKRKRTVPSTNNEVGRAMCIILCFMEKYKLDSGTIITQYRKQLQKTVPFDYELFQGFDKLLNDTYNKMRIIGEYSNKENFVKFICDNIISGYSRYVEQHQIS